MSKPTEGSLHAIRRLGFGRGEVGNELAKVVDEYAVAPAVRELWIAFESLRIEFIEAVTEMGAVEQAALSNSQYVLDKYRHLIDQKESEDLDKTG
ncbi:MAG: hypothetical protein ACR2PW_04740 [Gammaproteobacteria bacterium]